MVKARAVHASMVVLAVVGALAAAGCVSTDQPSSPALAADAKPAAEAKAELPPSAYLSMLRSHGIGAAIPTRGKFVLVNIPSFELIALEDGSPVLRSRVVVGQPKAATPEMLSSMFALRFNPSWTPTPSMIRNEGLHYMPPGPQNPLGRVMFDLDNDEFIYLHDTNERALFNRPQRALSHGCVRVEQARALAAWALGVSELEIDAMIAKGTYSEPLPEVIPVSLAYHTQFPDESGQIVSYPDIYGHNHRAELSDPPTTLPER
ncbi:L,D-transpeptidase family protein [Reyranella sp.]|uniref:L,D-transpeptidase family protein n=1 Tax=Reyranella sp. TaxID=1929291 RepID=UPI003D0B365D